MGNFDVVAKFKKVKPTSDRSFVETVAILYKLENGQQLAATLEQGNKVVVTNEDVPFTTQVNSFPYTSSYFPGIQILQSNNPVEDFGAEWHLSPSVTVMKFNNGMRVLWDGIKRVKIYIHPDLAGYICGICGPILDYTGDLIIGPHDNTHLDDSTGCPNKASGLPFGAITWDEQEYGDSWFHHTAEDDPACLNECGGE